MSVRAMVLLKDFLVFEEGSEGEGPWGPQRQARAHLLAPTQVGLWLGPR